MPSTFWATQPVDDRVGVVAPGGVGGDGLPDPLRFAAFDPSTAADLERLRALLAEHYVEDGETGFRLEYGRELLAWALGGAGQERDWCVAVEDGGGRMGGFVFAAPARVSIDGWTREAVMVNYLCVRSDLRGMGLGPILIREVTRRVVARGRSCAIFSTAARLPMEPLAACRYLCRFLRPSELVASGWVARPDYLTPGQFERIHELPEPAVALRRMTEADLPEVTALFDRRTSAVRLQLTAAELRHALVGAPAGVVETWVTEDGA
ncbi:MAG TPA: hypothetical protein VJ276_16835, partial [Thermoanaerobaculia bacterium]|nr:hypothetical protein [Thermoanaerobaculia bacterium]